MNDVKQYLQEISKTLEYVCRNNVPDTLSIPAFGKHNFDNFDIAFTEIMQEFAILENAALNLHVRYAVKLAIIKSHFAADYFVTAHVGNTNGNLAELADCVTVQDMADVTAG